MRVLVLACSIALAATVARAQVNGPITISPHDDTAPSPGAASPEPHAVTPAPSDNKVAPTPAPAPPAPSAAAPSASPPPPSAGLAPPAATPPPAPKRQREVMPPGAPDLYGGPPEGPLPEFAPERPHGLRARFDAANVTHDGRLTPEQAMMGGMRGVARHFAEIDRDNRGYVTLQDIRAWRRARRRQHMTPPAAEPGGPPEPGGPAENQ